MNAKERNRLMKITRLAREIEKFSAPFHSKSNDSARQKRAATLRTNALNRKKIELGWVLGNEPNQKPTHFLRSITLGEADSIIAEKLESAKKEAVSKLRAASAKKNTNAAKNGKLGGRPKKHLTEEESLAARRATYNRANAKRK
jgi:hypothetical protein